MSMQTWFNAMELGRQHNREDEAIQRRNAFASLAQKAYAAPADQRAGIVGKAVGIDPAQGFALQENMQAGEDRQRQQLVNMARLLTSSPVEARSGIYQRIRPGLAQLGINAPATYEENPQLIDQTAQGLIKSAGPAQNANLTPTVQSLVWQRDNGYLDEEGFRTALAIANRQEAGAAPPGYSVVDQWNPQTQQMEKTLVQTRGYMPGGGSMAPNIGQSTPQAGGNQQITVYPENIPPSEYNQFLNALPPEARAAASQGGTFANGAQVAPPGIDATSTPQPTMPGGGRVIGASGPSAADQARIDADRAALIKTAEADAARQAEAQSAAPQARQRISSVQAQAQSIFKEIDDALPMINSQTTGVFGAAARRIAGSPAYDLATKLATIKANLGFDRLQQMRDESPTGGALGQVAVQELEGLQATIANLDPNMSPPQLKENLEKVRGHYTRWRDATVRALEEQVQRGERPPVEGARKARDGQWYVEKNGQYFRVDQE